MSFCLVLALKVYLFKSKAWSVRKPVQIGVILLVQMNISQSERHLYKFVLHVLNLYILSILE